MSFFTFLFTCTHVWSILEVGGGKMSCQIIVLIGNNYFNYLLSKRDQFEVIKPQYLPKIGEAKHKVRGSKLKLMG